jgi:hypothetical protein
MLNVLSFVKITLIWIQLSVLEILISSVLYENCY